MAHTYPGSNIFPATITLPDDGDAAAASSWNPAHEGLADRTEWLRNRTGGYAVNKFGFDFDNGLTMRESAPGAVASFTPVTGFGTGGEVTLFGGPFGLFEGDQVMLDTQVHLYGGASVLIDLKLQYKAGALAWADASGMYQRISVNDPDGPNPHAAIMPGFVTIPVGGAGDFVLRFVWGTTGAASIQSPHIFRALVIRVNPL